MHQELFEKYYYKELIGEALNNFEKKLVNNPEFKEEYLSYKNISDAFREDGKIECLIRDISNIDDNHKPVIRRRHYAAAASVILLMTCSWFFIEYMNSYSNSELYTLYFEPYKIIKRGECENDNRKPYNLYAEKKYDQAIIGFVYLLDKDESIPEANFFLGISYMQTNKFDEAVKCFKVNLDNQPNLLVELSEWYAGLCYLKLENDEKAKEIFSEISYSGNSYTAKAEHILKYL